MDLDFQRQGLHNQVLKLALTFTLIQENFQRGWIRLYGAAEAANKFRGEGLEDQAVLFLEEGDLGTFADGVFAAELGGDDELAFGGDGGEFSFHEVVLFRENMPLKRT